MDRQMLQRGDNLRFAFHWSKREKHGLELLWFARDPKPFES